MSTLRVNNVTNVAGGATYAPGHVVQIQQAYKQDTFALSVANVWTDVPGLSASITPKFSTSKVLVTVMGYLNGASTIITASTRLVDGAGNVVGGSVSEGSRSSGIGSFPTSTVDNNSSFVMQYLDSPATTSSKTYKLQILADGTSGIYLNRSRADVNANYTVRGISSITLMEVAV